MKQHLSANGKTLYFDEALFCRVELFPDNPVPPLKRALQMFNRAFLVVAPHGAGLSNVFFSEPGTIIIEGLCYEGRRANLCYRSVCESFNRSQLGERAILCYKSVCR